MPPADMVAQNFPWPAGTDRLDDEQLAGPDETSQHRSGFYNKKRHGKRASKPNFPKTA